MTQMMRSARLLMTAAARVAPDIRRSWVEAMQGEMEELNGLDALGWATGALTAALGWRFRAEAVFLAALVATPVLSTLAFVLLLWVTPMAFVFDAMRVGSTGLSFVGAFGLALAWPRRAALAAFVAPLYFIQSATGFIVSVLGSAKNTAQVWTFAMSFGPMIVTELSPGIAGALAGWASARLIAAQTKRAPDRSGAL